MGLGLYRVRARVRVGLGHGTLSVLTAVCSAVQPLLFSIMQSAPPASGTHGTAHTREFSIADGEGPGRGSDCVGPSVLG